MMFRTQYAVCLLVVSLSVTYTKEIPRVLIPDDISTLTTEYSSEGTFENLEDQSIASDLDDTRNQEDSNIEDVEINDSNNIKAFNKSQPFRTLESASRVILQANYNNSINDVLYERKPENISEITKNKKNTEENVVRSSINKKSNIRAHIKYDEVTGELVNEEHPCQRECIEGDEPMICHYHFNLEWYHTMSKACYDCPYNLTDCNRIDCIPADGMRRALNVINRKMPGPAIEVCHNDIIVVDVENDLMTESTTVHWHGQHQRGTPYMDGTPYVTQCPILPESTFRYKFNATHAGTHFWHSHSGMQRADGAAGALIIRKPRTVDPHGQLYDYDKSEHVMIVTDWIHELSVSMFVDHHHSIGDNKPPTLLINGVGRFRVFNETSEPKYMKAATFNVDKGYKYRFRVINAEFLNCPIELSVDDHNITVIASDGYDLEPITATSLVTYAGERYDFVLDANQDVANYWIRFRGLMDCDERFTKAKQVAVLHYEGASDVEPEGDPTWEELHNEGLQLNALNKGEEENETISVAEMRSLQGYDDSLKEIADYQFYVAYDFYAKNNSHFHRSPYYGYYQVPHKDNRLYTPQLNHISMKMPSSPLLLDRPSPDNFCNMSSISEDCKEGYCECSHVLSVKKNAVVEIIIVDEGVTFDANHPFHLHGHNFRVVGMRRLANDTTIEEIKAYDEAGLLKRNLKNAPLKDTVTVPDGGYTVIRFKADNPGYWLFHCHIEFHVEIGMALVFKVGEHKDMVPVPSGFPQCGNYIPDHSMEATEKPKTDSQYISINHWWPVVLMNNNSTSSASCLDSINALVVLSCVWLLKLIIDT
ncbi:PREDICTED: laccase-4-like [Papilio xuthus]|uniref:Laccase-4-like n=1 Tax=Papilio xuthus TaxID=66420 RepID=A0AAJ6ZB78_PAPXU|nr:PREDICTED: laccase-4-like [Papilio xuthus]XP_013168844.1 PREDICTED: laccase-4-like [Papilio xuthus]XP_013168846.1 PREDICTED: laccase-4-like [Papilio xuthus]